MSRAPFVDCRASGCCCHCSRCYSCYCWSWFIAVLLSEPVVMICSLLLAWLLLLVGGVVMVVGVVRLWVVMLVMLPVSVSL